MLNAIGPREWIAVSIDQYWADVVEVIRRAETAERRGRRMRLAFTVYATQVRNGSPPSGPGRPGAVSLFRDHGMRPDMFRRHVQRQGGLEEALVYLANQRERVEVGGSVVRIEAHGWEEV